MKNRNRIWKWAHLSRRLIQRIGIKMCRVSDPVNPRKIEIGEAEYSASVIFRKMLKMEDSELLVCPLTQRSFIKNDRNNILIILNNYEINVINHIFAYNVRITPHTYKKLNNIFVSEVSIRRTNMENRFRQNIKHSLQTIIENISEEIDKKIEDE